MFSPKQRFNASPDRKSFHSALVVNPTFLDALDAAMLQYGDNLDSEQAPQVESGVRLKGAREFKRILLTLCETPNLSARRDPDNLKKV